MPKEPKHKSLFYRAFFKKGFSLSIRRGPALVSLAAFLLTLGIVLLDMNAQYIGNLDEFEVGKVAVRDVIANHAVDYLDEAATRLQQDAIERQTPAVFLYSETAKNGILDNWNRFTDLIETLNTDRVSRQIFIRRINENFPDFFSAYLLDDLYNSSEIDEVLFHSSLVLDEILLKGIFPFPHADMERLNNDVVELVRDTPALLNPERLPAGEIITMGNLGEALNRLINSDAFFHEYSLPFVLHGRDIIEPFLSENVVYSQDITVRNIEENRRRAEPVYRHVEKDKRVIRSGFIVSEEQMKELRVLAESRPGSDGRAIASHIILLLLLYAILAYYCSCGIIDHKLSNAESYLISALSALYMIGAVLSHNIGSGINSIYNPVIMPTALVIMLLAILINYRLAVILALILPMGAFFIGSFDTSTFIFAVMSGIAASFTLRGAEKRMDVINAGLVVAAANCIIIVAVLLWQRTAPEHYPFVLFWASFNGLASGMLVLGFLPLLESLLNSATAFRLIELSDLNTPALRNLFSIAPGTYSHSIMVANLAETACQDIGANALLARVGAYYHDLGKTDNPEYFVENQTDYNIHDDMGIGQSIAEIRKHVSGGLEKGRQLRLPPRVMEIIGEHHGSSVITWFYNKALQIDENAAREDFSYLGNPPSSKESAVVMLADTVEAAARTLQKPTPEKIDEFIQELIDTKLQNGQLSQSDLTFKELDTIKHAFIRVLSGNYHSRIEYPKLQRAHNGR